MTADVPPPTASTGALAAFGATSTARGDETPVPRKRVLSWAMWDWAMQPFNTVILTFVWIALYLTSRMFLEPDVRESGLLADGSYMSCNDSAYIGSAYCQGLTDLSEWWGWANFAAGILILLLAPVLGQQADARGSKKKWVIGATIAIALVQFSLFFVEADPKFFWFGALAVAIAAIVSEIGNVSYYAMLSEVSTPKNVGRISGLGWGLGYVGGVVALIVCIPVLFLIGQDDPLSFKLVAVICAVWTLVFSIPMFRNVPESPAYDTSPKVGFFRSYVVLGHNIANLFRTNRPTFWFMLAAAVYRDGLAGVFAFGAVLAAQGFGFSFLEVIVFGLAANLVAGVSTLLAGRLDDAIGPSAPDRDHAHRARRDGVRGVRAARPGRDRVLGLRSAAVRVRRAGAGRQPQPAHAAHPARPAGRDLRSVRHDRPCGLVPVAPGVVAVPRRVRGDHLRRPRHRPDPADRAGAAAVRALPQGRPGLMRPCGPNRFLSGRFRILMTTPER
ncbi:MFS transporter [Microbacterium sp. KUDC0406]|uniref:MFS transporter n=1 Tax=Microbacterium sp. KUDC0406 TaxID=2909588 RepID=UPI003FA5D5E4